MSRPYPENELAPIVDEPAIVVDGCLILVEQTVGYHKAQLALTLSQLRLHNRHNHWYANTQICLDSLYITYTKTNTWYVNNRNLLDYSHKEIQEIEKSGNYVISTSLAQLPVITKTEYRVDNGTLSISQIGQDLDQVMNSHAIDHIMLQPKDAHAVPELIQYGKPISIVTTDW